jgi:hypothetical protein
VVGACAALQRAHLPVGVITRADLDNLDECPVIVLPSVTRMDDAEVAAFRGYVERGGHLYASGRTSLLHTDGIASDDFALADVFGCHAGEPEPAMVSYLRPVRDDLAEAIAPAAVVPHGNVTASLPFRTAETLRITVDRTDVATTVLATHTHTYEMGTGTKTSGWASIFTNPPWVDGDEPLIVEHRLGSGRVVYSACEIELSVPASRGAERLFVALVRGLLDETPTFEADTHPAVWIVGYNEPAERRIRLNLLNHQLGTPPLPIPRVTLRISPPKGDTFTRLVRLPGGEPIDFDVEQDGRMRTELRDLQLFDMIAAEYGP